jgi:hypothetical protein
MNLPGFTADAARGKTMSAHQCIRSGPLESSDLGNSIYMQGCPWYEWIGCAAKVSFCTSGCTAAGSFSWYACMTQCLFLIGAAPCLRCLS